MLVFRQLVKLIGNKLWFLRGDKFLEWMPVHRSKALIADDWLAVDWRDVFYRLRCLLALDQRNSRTVKVVKE